MKKKPTGIVFCGILFLAIGLIWLSSIYQRSVWYQASKLTAKKSYAQVYRSAAGQSQRLKQVMVTSRRQPLPVERFMPKVYIIHFWMIACLELVCSLLYILAGVGLLRRYHFACPFVFYTLLGDLLLKMLVVSYHVYILLPLQKLFNTANLIFVYFKPNTTIVSQISVYLTGLKFLQPDFLAYALTYVLYVVSVWYYFTRPAIKAQFKRRQ